ncbi:MAG: hypothetical protein ACYSU8_11235 [Planctomycetota bacterium]|jgi:tetratricopeptide (TPR) repeat protein
MIAFFRQLCAAPFKILLFLLRFFHQNNTALIRLIWHIGGEIDYANMLISSLAQKDIVAAREEARALLEKTHDGQIASTMAIFELYAARNAIAACQWIKDAEALECNRSESLLLAKLCLGDRTEDYDAEQTAMEIISRNDLPMNYTSQACLELVEGHIKHQRWEQAEKILNRILSIEANPSAYAYKWIVELYHGNTKEANLCLAKYKQAVPASHTSVFEAVGYYYLNDLEQAKMCLKRAINEYAVTRDYICFVKKELEPLLDGEAIGAEG